MSNPTKSREVHLIKRPHGLPTDESFELVTVDLPTLEAGQVLVKNLWLSVDPYMRGRMSGNEKSYVPPFNLGEVMDGGAVGQVVASQHEKFTVGDFVLSSYGWREAFVASGKGLQKIAADEKLLSAYLSILGMPGHTAYAGLFEIGKLQRGDTVFVSGAAGAVGSVVCQIAKEQGCRVIGSAGSEEKVIWLLDEIGIDGAINYKSSDSLVKSLAELCPAGIDLYFENVGGSHLEAALELMNNYGRVVVCGLIAQYNATQAVASPRNFAYILTKRLRVQGFIVTDHQAIYKDFVAYMTPLLKSGQFKWRQTVYEGLEQATTAFLGLFSGENMGKMVVKVGEPQVGDIE